ncbi:hypothetical protein OZX60_02675 [Streptococcaceae bacterium ESL0687]|nr:hypothetical protein OZX60_02675 [Streptococcaceae bacterium ESL0687]
MIRKFIKIFSNFSVATTIILLASIFTGTSLDNSLVGQIMITSLVSTIFCMTFLNFFDFAFKSILAVLGVLLIVGCASLLFDWKTSFIMLVTSFVMTAVIIAANYRMDKTTAEELNRQIKTRKSHKKEI